MVSQDSTSEVTGEATTSQHLQKRHTIAAVVYFLYGLFYLFGAQYLTNMRAMERSMANPTLFFILGGVLTILLPLLIYHRCGLALSLSRRTGTATYVVNFTLILGLLVSARVAALLRGELYAKTPLHTAALVIAAINAVCLLWVGLSRPFWVDRHPSGA